MTTNKKPNTHLNGIILTFLQVHKYVRGNFFVTCSNRNACKVTVYTRNKRFRRERRAQRWGWTQPWNLFFICLSTQDTARKLHFSSVFFLYANNFSFRLQFLLIYRKINHHFSRYYRWRYRFAHEDDAFGTMFIWRRQYTCGMNEKFGRSLTLIKKKSEKSADWKYLLLKPMRATNGNAPSPR